MNKYLNPLNYLRYGALLFKKVFLSIPAKPLELYIVNKYGDIGIRNHPPVFIIGAPRSGSTLLSQVLVQRYKFTFLSNFIALFYETPVLASWVAKQMGLKTPIGDYKSEYGKTKGWGAPNECGPFFYRWFPADMSRIYVPSGTICQEDLKQFRNTLGAISYFGDASMLTKNLFNSLRIGPILDAIPEAMFIVCKRNYVENALDILQSRIIKKDNKKSWIGPPPKEITKLQRLHYSEQIVGQIHYIYKQIDEDKKQYGHDRFIEVQYEELCENVIKVITKVEKKLTNNHIRLKNNNNKLPNNFNKIKVKYIDDKDIYFITKAVNLYYPDINKKTL